MTIYPDGDFLNRSHPWAEATAGLSCAGLPRLGTSDASEPCIAYLTGEYPKISHTFILREVEGLRERGLRVETCSIRRPGPEHLRGRAERSAANTTFYVVPAASRLPAVLLAMKDALMRPGRLFDAVKLALRTRQPGMKGMLWQFFYLIEAIVVARHLRMRRADHIHNHFGDSSCTVTMLAATLLQIPFSFTLHGPSIFFEPKAWHLGEKIAKARLVVCISRFCRSQARMFCARQDWHKLRIVHCAVDTQRYGTSCRSGTGKQVLFVGRLAAAKGVSVLLEAFSHVLKQHPEAKLKLVGDGPERADLEAEAVSLGCADAVEFTGLLTQEEVCKELSEADVFALPSFAEGVPVVLMEAMASHVPVVATRVAGVPELVEDGVSGLLVTAGDFLGLAAAISELLSDEPLRRAMGAAGRAKVTANYDIRNEAARLERLLLGEAEIVPMPAAA